MKMNLMTRFLTTVLLVLLPFMNAFSEEGDKEYCEQTAKEEGIPADEIRDFVKDCMEDLKKAVEEAQSESKISE